ncbi:MAG: DUF3817 domain-containing protein [Microbacteriaceae bacterium]|nr:DUF3817 domain-containing protein [Microbacteriaceae bacterium]
MNSTQTRKDPAPQIRKALKFFKIASTITGVMLFGLYVISFIRWFGHSDIYLFGNELVALQQLPAKGVEIDFKPAGVNFTTIFLVVHGWFYVVYLIAGFGLWSAMRWPFWRFIAIIIAGCVLIVSFIVEAWLVRDTQVFLASNQEKNAGQKDPDATFPAGDGL